MLSQTAEYALRAMACLALRPDELVATSVLAEQTKVPNDYLAKVLQHLSSADLIQGRRGVGGGYRLARPATTINLLDVINAIDAIKRIESCPLGLPNHGPMLCPVHRRLDQAAAALIELFNGVTLHDLIADPMSSKPLCDAKATAKLGIEGTLSDRRPGKGPAPKA